MVPVGGQRVGVRKVCENRVNGTGPDKNLLNPRPQEKSPDEMMVDCAKIPKDQRYKAGASCPQFSNSSALHSLGKKMRR